MTAPALAGEPVVLTTLAVDVLAGDPDIGAAMLGRSTAVFLGRFAVPDFATVLIRATSTNLIFELRDHDAAVAVSIDLPTLAQSIAKALRRAPVPPQG